MNVPAANTSSSPVADRATATPRTIVPRVDSRHLLDATRELIIEHAGQEYRLRLTCNDKLILTK